ncbi:MAG: hypothetical protein NDF58_08700 [archaeon YNP-LCB-024-027]|nr:hypothetical protein [Candidatus Culexarchaeum yellowstonense]
MMRFEKALKFETVELKEELLWEYPCAFLEETWREIKHELKKYGEVNWNMDRFLERVGKETESRGWDLRKFRNEKGEPVLNLFKRIIREIAKESDLPLSNDTLSKLLNYIRSQYSTAGVLTGAIFPVRAFFERDEYGIPNYYKTGDDNSCFRVGGCNYGSSLWLCIEDEKFDRAKLVVFHFKSGNKEGWGRCWIYRVSEWAIFATNFYSWGFEIKSQWLKFPLVRVIRSLFDLSENVRFAFGKNIYLPIYLNGDGLIIYEKEHYNSSDEIYELSKKIISECMYCHTEIALENLRILDREEYYEGEEISGLIVCRECQREIEDSEICESCDGRYFRDEMYYHDNAFWCEDCFYERFAMCVVCEEYYRRNDMIVDRAGNWLCEDCAHDHREYCEKCGEYVYPEEGHYYEVLHSYGIAEEFVCYDCEEDLREAKCECCGREYHYFLKDYVWRDKVREMVNAGLCYECYEKKLNALKDEIFKNNQQSHLPFELIDLMLLNK